ncbi:hypothetical protein OG746_19115 [Streptomyces sp. NBC_01016]|uniref:hypothetical protein n=1 Tax=Streptomyces sp. NBC_01016 TaxID=2903720 RepID=UPI002251A73A|nr:hypothetical protein [Streptomyces sp. NBC_01016]MCX4830844.1 hypothetical protein [Streptomyces sp. NBC_01016]
MSQGRDGQVSGVRWAVRAAVWALVLVSFALPLRHGLVATRAYVDGYWATANEQAENSDTFVWRSPHGEAVHGIVHGLGEEGYYDEALEPGQTLGPLRIWVSASGTAHVDEAPPENAMVFGYGAALAVAGATAYVMWAMRRARDPR